MLASFVSSGWRHFRPFQHFLQTSNGIVYSGDCETPPTNHSMPWNCSNQWWLPLVKLWFAKFGQKRECFDNEHWQTICKLFHLWPCRCRWLAQVFSEKDLWIQKYNLALVIFPVDNRTDGDKVLCSTSSHRHPTVQILQCFGLLC